MRLTEALVKPMFARAMSTNRVKALNSAFKKHLGLDEAFAQVQSENGSGKVWKPVGFHGFECRLFSKKLDQNTTRPREPAIDRVVHEVWPDLDQTVQLEPQAAIRSNPRNKSRKPTSREKEWGGASEAQQREYKRQYLCLWCIFDTVMDQMRCRDPDRADLKDFGKNCCDLGARWCMMMPKNRCGALYLHTLMMHGGAFMEHLLPLKLTIGMLENSGAERRHQIGKVHFRKSLAGGGKQYSGMASNENRTAFLTMRGVLIWQLGRDLLALEIAKEQQKPAPDKISCRGRSASGYSGELSKIATHVVPTHSEQSNQSMLGLQADQPDPQEMDLDANEFLNQHHRLERLDAGCQIDLVAELEAEHGELGDAMDDEGGLQVKAGPYIEKLDFRCGTGSDDESSVDAGSEDRSALSGCSEHESNSESESEEASL
jgi:hypothetical protein